VLRWDSILYTWPNMPPADEANFLYLPLSRSCGRVDGRARMRDVLAGRAGYWALPMLYNSFVHRDLIAELRARTGRVFGSACPDVYSGFAFAYLAGSYTSVSVPLGISGLSGKSNGVALLRQAEVSSILSEFNDLNTRFNYVPHPHVPDLRLEAVTDADSFAWVKQRLFPEDTLSLDRQLLAERCLKGLWVSDPVERRLAVDRIRASLVDRPDLREWFEGLRPEEAPPGPRPRVRPEGAHDGQGLGLRADRFGVADVAGAAELAARLLDYAPGSISYDLPPRWEKEVSYGRSIAQLRGELETVRASLQEDVRSAQAAYYSLYRSWTCLPLRLVHSLRRLLGRKAG
jgi:hypothetical protein